jgi:hypothetical protein
VEIPKTDEQEITTRFAKCGLIYSHESPTHFSVFVTRSLNSTIHVNDSEDYGIRVFWTSSGPSDEELLTVRSFLRCDVKEVNFLPSVASIFDPSTKQLSRDSSLLERHYVPARKPRWLLITIPFQQLQPHLQATIPPLHLENVFEYFPASPSSESDDHINDIEN